MNLDSHLQELVKQAVTEALQGMRDEWETLAYSEEHAADLIGVAKHTLRDCRLRGEITASRVGRGVVYRRSDLIDFLEDRMQ